MSGFAEAPSPGAAGPGGGAWSRHRFGPPLPLKIAAVVAAFCVFHPLGIGLAAWFLWRSAHDRGGCAVRRFGDRAGWPHHRSGAFRNTAFEERRRETLKTLDEEAEAFDAFERQQRESRDREAFERFLAERNAPKGAEEPK